MARRLGDELNEMRFQDNLSNSEIVLQYRMPTTPERVAYTNEAFQRKGRKIISRPVETRLKYGLKILKGFREGDFEIKGSDGTWIVISSDVESDHYNADWKEHVEKYASDIVELLAIRVFDVPVQAAVEEDAEEETGEEGSDPN